MNLRQSYFFPREGGEKEMCETLARELFNRIIYIFIRQARYEWRRRDKE